jgi:AP-1 complex subunit gamma-1
VALTTLTKASQNIQSTDTSSLQRHKATILDCLRDPDISIRRRALDLSFHLITTQNIRILTRELLSFLEICETDIKASVASRITDLAGRYRPNKRWEIDTNVRVLRVAGSWVEQATVNHFVKLVTTSANDLQLYTVRKLYNMIRVEGDLALVQEGLLQAMAWCVGEFGDVLVDSSMSVFGAGGDTGAGEEGAEGAGVSDGDYQAAPLEKDVVDMFDTILRGPYATLDVMEYMVTALVKLSGRFQQEFVLEYVSYSPFFGDYVS